MLNFFLLFFRLCVLLKYLCLLLINSQLTSAQVRFAFSSCCYFKMGHTTRETLQLIERFFDILKEAGMLKSYYFSFCLSEAKNDHFFIFNFQHFIDDLKDVFFQIFNKWESLQSIHRKEEHNLTLNYETSVIFNDKSPEHCIINRKDVDNVITSCRLTNYPKMNEPEFRIRDANSRSHQSIKSTLENVSLSIMNGSCEESNQPNNIEIHNTLETNPTQNENEGVLENVHYCREYSQSETEIPSNTSNNNSNLTVSESENESASQENPSYHRVHNKLDAQVKSSISNIHQNISKNESGSLENSQIYSHLEAETQSNISNSNISENRSTSLDNSHYPRVYSSLGTENQLIGNNAFSDVLNLEKDDYLDKLSTIGDSASQSQSCVSQENVLGNVLSLPSAFCPTDSIKKINPAMDSRNIILGVITYGDTQPKEQAQTHDSLAQADYDDGPLENESLEPEDLIERKETFSTRQTTVDASVLNNSSSRFPSYYPLGKLDTSQEGQTYVYPSVTCSKLNEVEEKTSSCSYYKDVSRVMKPKTDGSKLKDHFQQKITDGKKSFVCSYCSDSFSRIGSIRSHLSKTHKILSNPTVTCELCGKEFSKKISLQLHIDSFHKGLKPFECHICFKRFSQKVVLDTHVIRHTGLFQYGCDECGKQFAAKHKLRFHIQTHGDPQYKCNFCKKSFTTKQYLHNHQKTHSSVVPEDAQTCKLCSAVCPNQAALRKHQRYKHSNKTFLCDSPGCDKSFISQAALLRHQDRLHNANKKMYQCKDCDRNFSQEKSLLHHIKQNHTTGLSEEQLRPYLCTICNKRYAFANKLKLHIQMHTQEPPQRCHLCTKTFYRLDSLKLHMSSKHFYASQLGFSRSHPCDVCGRSFATNSGLKTHQAMQHQSRQDMSFECTHCRKVYKSKFALETHLKKHDEQCSFECSICHKKFPRKCYLDDHIQSHMTERSFKCNLCSRSFKRDKHLREHTRRVHPNHITVDSLLESITNESSDQQNLLPAIKEELRISLAAL